jgi:hypothetical protein
MLRAAKQPAEMRRITSAVMRIAAPKGFTEAGAHPPSSDSMSAWAYYAETNEFKLEVVRERDGHVDICVGSKVRRQPRVQMRGPWSLSHLRGYLDGGADHFIFADTQEQIRWLKNNIESVLDTHFLNSDELQRWAVKASRRMFGQDPR